MDALQTCVERIQAVARDQGLTEMEFKGQLRVVIEDYYRQERHREFWAFLETYYPPQDYIKLGCEGTD